VGYLHQNLRFIASLSLVRDQILDTQKTRGLALVTSSLLCVFFGKSVNCCMGSSSTVTFFPVLGFDDSDCLIFHHGSCELPIVLEYQRVSQVKCHRPVIAGHELGGIV